MPKNPSVKLNADIISNRLGRTRLGGWLKQAALVVGAATTLGCLSVEAEAPEVEMTRRALTFEGVPGAEQGGPMARTVTFAHPYDALHLSFLQGFTLVIASKDPSAPEPVQVFDYTRDDAESPGPELRAVASSSPNVFDYWKTGSTEYTMTVYGQLPEQAWTVDVVVGFRGKAKFEM
jgi:hypothetical protein